MVVILLLTVSTNTNNGCDELNRQPNRGYSTKSTEQYELPAKCIGGNSGYNRNLPLETKPRNNNEFHLCPPSQKFNKINKNTCAECINCYPSHVQNYEFDQLRTALPKTAAYYAKSKHNEHNRTAATDTDTDTNVLKLAHQCNQQTNLIPKPPRGIYYNNNINNNNNTVSTNLLSNANNTNATKDYYQQCTGNCQNYFQYKTTPLNYCAGNRSRTNDLNAAHSTQCYYCNNNNTNYTDYTRYVTRVNFYEINTSQVDSLSKDGSTSSIETNTKEEEWITKKKTELTTTKQIETRVQRELLFEDGKVIEDSGAIVSTNTTEDTDKKESETTEKRNLGLPDKNDSMPLAIEQTEPKANTLELNSYSKSFPAIDSNSLLREINAKRVISQAVTDDLLETEIVKHFGDVVDEDYVNAVNSGVENLDNLEEHLVTLAARKDAQTSEAKILKNTTKTKKTIDSEDINKRWLGQIDGTIITEEKKTTEHEIIADQDLPAEDDDKSTGSREHVNTVQATQRFFKQRDENHVDLLANGKVVGTEMRYAAETVQMEKDGSLERVGDWDSLSERVRRQRRAQQKALLQQQKDRKDALTKRPLDFDLEEETRKGETMKWLESHFGSDSNGSVDSHFNDNTVEPTKKTFFNVTIKSNHAQMSPIPEQIAEHRKLKPSDSYVSRDDILQQKRKSLSLQFLTDSERGHSNTYVRDPTKYKIPLDSPHNFHIQTPLVEERPPFSNLNQLDGSKNANYVSQRSLQNLSEKRSTSDTKSYYHSNSHIAATNNVSTLDRPAVPQRRRNASRTHSNQLNGMHSKLNIKLVEQNELLEPPPDYSPPSRHERAPSFEDASPTSIISVKQPSQHTLTRKQNQNTRFATNIQQAPPPLQQPRYNMTTQTTQTSSSNTALPPQTKSNRVSQAIGNSIRKLVDKIRSASAERKLRKKSRSKSRDRSPVNNKDKLNNETTTYQQYNVIDSHIDGPYNYETKKPISEKSLRRTSYESEKYQNEHFRAAKIDREGSPTNDKDLEHTQSPRQRYYLGEDPYTTTLRRTAHEQKYLEQSKPYRDYGYTNGYKNNQQTAYTLGRNPKNSYVTGSMPQLNNDFQTSQTLPRKLQHRHQSEQPQYTRNRTSITFAENNTLQEMPSRISNQDYAPSKPMRMPPKALIRSKSLNFNALNEDNDSSYYDNAGKAYERQPYKSSVNLYKVPKENTLNDSLKSPSIVNLISRSQKDLSRVGIGHEPDAHPTTNTINRYNNKSSLKQQIENAQQLRSYREKSWNRNDETNGINKVLHLQRAQSIAQPSVALDFVKDQASIIRRDSTDDQTGHYRSSKPIEMPYKQSIHLHEKELPRRPPVGELRKLYNRK